VSPDARSWTPRMVSLAVLGSGPTGLEAALAGVQRGWDVTVYEQAPHVAGHVREWGHVRLSTRVLSVAREGLLKNGEIGSSVRPGGRRRAWCTARRARCAPRRPEPRRAN